MDPEEVLYLRDGTVLPIPEGMPRFATERFKREFADILMPEPTTMGAIGEALLNVPRGFVSTAALMGRGLAEVLPGDMGGAEFASGIMRAIQESQDPRYADNFLAQLGTGIGSIGAFALPAIATGGAGAPALGAAAGAGALTGVGEQAERIDAARERGVAVSPEDEFLAKLGGAAVGLSEAAPIGRLAGRLRRAAGIGAREAVSREASREVREGALLGALKTGLAEGTQEVLAGTGQNVISRYLYDPEQEIAPGIEEFTVGGTAGALFDLLGSAAARRAGRFQRTNDWLAELQKRRFRLAQEAPIRVDQVLQDEAAAREAGLEWSPTQYAREYDVQETQPGVFQVIDQQTGEAISPAMSFDQAQQQLATLTQEDTDKILAAYAIQTARDQGLESSPEAVQAIYMALHPDTRELPITSVAAQLTSETEQGAFLKDPRSLAGVRAFRRGFSQAEQAELDEAMGEVALAEESLAEARERAPTYRADPVAADAGVREVSPSRTNTRRGMYNFTIDGREYRILKYGSLGWAVFTPESNVPYGYAPTLREGEEMARQIERDVRSLQAQEKRKGQQRYIDRLRRRREQSLAEAKGKVEKLARDVAENPEDQPNLDRLAEFAAQGRLSITPEEARDILRKDYDQLLMNLSGITLNTQRELMRELRRTRTRAGKPRTRTKAETLDLLQRIAEDFREKAAVADGELVEMSPENAPSDTDLRTALRNRGWDPAGMEPYASLLLGRRVESIKTLTPGERMYLLSKFATMEAGNEANPLPLPDPNVPTYSRAQYDYTLNYLRENRDTPIRRGALVSRIVQDLEDDNIATTRQQVGQILDNALRAGRLKTTSARTGVANGIQYASDTPALAEQPIRERRIQKVAQDLANRTGRETPTVGQQVIAEEILLAAQNVNDRLSFLAQQQQAATGQALDAAALADANKRRVDRAVDALTDTEILEQRMADYVAKRMNLTPEMRNRMEVRVARGAEQMAEIAGRKAVNPDAAGVFQAEPGNPWRIIINLAKVDPEGTKSIDEIIRDAEPTLLYETVRAMFEADQFTQTEKRAALRAAERLTAPDGRTYRERAEALLSDRDIGPGMDGYTELLTEQAMADMAADYRTGRIRDMSNTTAKGALNKVRKFLRDMADITRDSDAQDTLALIGEVATAGLGRAPGLSAINPAEAAEVRSLRETALEGLRAPPRVATPPPEPPEGPSAAPRALTPEEAAEYAATRDAENAESLAEGAVPKFGKNASPEAVRAYENSPVDATEAKFDPTLRYRVLRDAEGVDPFNGRYTSAVKYAPPQTGVLQRFFQAVKTSGLYDAMRGDDGQTLFNDIRRKFRSDLLDGRNEINLLDEMFGKFKRDQEGLNILADQQAIHAFRTADRLMQLVAEAMYGGTVRYVQGTRDAAGQFVRSTDPLAGHFVIDRAPLRTSSGREYASLLDVLYEPYSRGDLGEEWFDNYLIAKRSIQIAADAEEAGRRIRAEDFDSAQELNDLKRRRDLGKNLPGGKKVSEFQDLVAEVESRQDLRWMVDAAEGLTAWNDSILTMLRDSGLLGEQQYQAWLGQTYIPFTKSHQNVVSDSLRPKTKKPEKATRMTRVEQKLTGSDDVIDTDLYERVFSNFEEMVHDAIVNTGYARVVRALNELPPVNGVPRGRFVRRGEVPGGQGVIRYFENGEERLFALDLEAYPELEHTIAAMQFSGEDFYQGWVRAFPAAANLLRQGVTRMPDFVARNLFRDTFSIYVTSGSNMKPVLDTFRNFTPALLGKEAESFELAKQMGIALETDNLNDRNRHKQNIQRILDQREHAIERNWDVTSAFTKLWNYLGDLSRQSDTATRMAVYEDILKQTGNEAEAVKQALEVINYGRRGRNPVWRLVTASIPFLNARVQGLDVLYRAATGQYSAQELTPEGKRKAARDITREFFTRGAYLAMLTGAYYMLVRDEDWYKNLRDEVKDDYWIVPVGDGVGARLPVPFEVGLLFKTIPEMFMRVLDEEGYTGPEMAEDVLQAATQATMFSPAPQIISPLVDIWHNYNSFTRTPITPTYMEEGLPYQDRRNLSTSETAVMVSQLLSALPGVEIDPLKTEYLITGYIGTIGNYLLALTDYVATSGPAREIFNAIPLVDPLREQVSTDRVGTRADYAEATNLPLVGSLLQDLSRGGGYQQDFYEMRELINQTVAGINRARKEGREQDVRSLRHEYAALLETRPMIRRLDRYMARWRDRRVRLLQDDSMSPREKREKLRLLEEERDLQLAIVPFLRDVAANKQEM